MVTNHARKKFGSSFLLVLATGGIACLLLLAGCSSSQPSASTESATDQSNSADAVTSPAFPDVEFTVASSEDFEEGTIQYGGKYLRIVLNERDSAGYAWNVSAQGGQLHELAAISVVPSDETTGMDGMQEFVYEGTGAGTVMLTFTYENGGTPSDTVSPVVVNVTVAEDGTIASATQA